jgi:hypothetical protein
MEQDDARLSKVYPMITEFFSSLKREAENIGVCIGIFLDDHLLNDLNASIRGNRNDYEVEEENCDLRIDLATYDGHPTDHGVREKLRKKLKRHSRDKCAETYTICRSIVARKVFGTTDDLFFLADVLTPEGRDIICPTGLTRQDIPISVEADGHTLPHEEDGTPMQVRFPTRPVVPPLDCDGIMSDDILARDRTFAAKSDEVDVEAGETHDTEIDDDPGLDLQ